MKQLLKDRIRELSRPLEPVSAGAAVEIRPLKGIETVLFDVYGTLLISACGDIGITAAAARGELLARALNLSGYEGELERAGEEGTALFQDEIRRRHETAKRNRIPFPEVEIRRVWAAVLKKLQTQGILKPDSDEGKIMRLAVEYECLVNPVWPMPGALETVRRIKDRGLRLGIVSNAQFYTPLMLHALFELSPEASGFDPLLCVWSCEELRAKPSVELFQKLEKKIDLSRALYVGNDMLNDIWTAHQAGCKTVLFAGDRRSLRLRDEDPRCRDLKPDAVIDDLRQIRQILS